MTTLSRADLNLLVESLSGDGALSAEQIRWLARCEALLDRQPMAVPL
jgi:hypothetical protein